jgi:hypothetical protein
MSLIEEGRCNAPVKPWALRNIDENTFTLNGNIEAYSVSFPVQEARKVPFEVLHRSFHLG